MTTLLYKVFSLFYRDMDRRGAIELSMNTLVIVIISLVILGSGITLLYKFVDISIDKKEQLDQRTNEELEHLLVDQGKQVALPLHVADIQAGESHVFGLGILNSDKKYGNEFTINVELNKAIDKVGTDIKEEVKESTETWPLYSTDPLLIEENEHKKESILVDVPTNAKKGQYIFDVIIKTADGKPYGTKQKMIVNVK